MNTKNIYFDDKKIKKVLFTKTKKKFQIDGIDVNKILVSKIEPCSTKSALTYFIGYNDDVIRPLCWRLPQMTGYFKKVYENVTMSFRVNNKQFLEITIKYGKKLRS